jgi:hypothetical protein
VPRRRIDASFKNITQEEAGRQAGLFFYARVFADEGGSQIA